MWTRRTLLQGTSLLGATALAARVNGVEEISAASAAAEEGADAAAPAANKVRVWCRDSGGGKTQLVARLNTGAVRVIATEP